MKHSLKSLAALVAVMPNRVIHAQGARSPTGNIISCKHPKFSTTLYVANHPQGSKQKLEFSGNIKRAFEFTAAAAKNIRDDVLEHKTDVVIHRC